MSDSFPSDRQEGSPGGVYLSESNAPIPVDGVGLRDEAEEDRTRFPDRRRCGLSEGDDPTTCDEEHAGGHPYPKVDLRACAKQVVRSMDRFDD